MARRKGQGKKTGRKRPDLATTREVVEELFVRQPVNDAELKQRLAPLERGRTRQALVELLENGGLDHQDGALFEAAIRMVGLGTERERLINMVGRPGLPASLRIVVLNVLDELDREKAAPLLRSLPEEEQSQLFWAPLMELMVTLQSDPDAAVAVTDILLDMPEEEREAVLYQIGHCRRETGTPAAVVYRHALCSEQLAPLHGHMIDAVVEEGGSEGIALLELLRSQCKRDNGKHSRLQKALLRLRTHAIERDRSQPEAPDGTAYLSSCDGQGTFALLGCFDNPDGTATLSSLCVRVHGELRDALVLPRFDRAELTSFLDHYCEGAHCKLAEVSLAEAARLAGVAADRTRGMGLSLPSDAEPALALFGRTRPGDAPDDHPRGRGATLEQARRLLGREEYESWFFDGGDLDSVEVVLPEKATSAWVNRAAKALDTAPMRERLGGMARHMATWHQLRDEKTEASLCAGFARSLHDQFPKNALARVMLERSVERAAEDRQDSDDTRGVLGNPIVRRDLRARFFSELADPRGRHLARLDFTEAALVSLDDAVAGLPGHRRPQADQVVVMAHSIAETFSRLLLAPKTTRRKNWPGELADALMEAAPLDPEEAGQLMGTVLSDLDTFVEQICGRCPVACLERPAAQVADAFYAPEHPAQIGVLDELTGDAADDEEIPF